jgi:hypothetical protein
MTSVRFILEVASTGALIARGLDEPVLLRARNLADLRTQLQDRFAARDCKPILVAVRAADAGTDAVPTAQVA